MQSRTRRAAGFTLVELLVAMIAGMLVAAAAFAFSKSSTRFFSQEARIASAQMSVITGFQRLQADIARASYLGSPNITRDKDFDRLCAPNYALWPPMMQKLAGVQITRGGSSVNVPALPDGNYPDSIRIMGSFAATDAFPVDLVEPGAQGSDIYLGSNSGAMARAGLTPGSDIAAVFKPGRVIRILDLQGKQEYGLIRAASYPANGRPVISTRDILPIKGEDAQSCGIGGMGTGTQASVLSIIEYGIMRVRGLTGNNADIYAATLYSEAGSAPGDDTRTELVRREVLVADQPPVAFNLDNGVEVVAEYAVDLRFGLWVGNNSGVGLSYVPPSDTAIDTRMAVANSYVAGTPPTGPESVRALEVRLVVRSREVDRSAVLDPAVTGGNVSLDGGYMFRFPLPNNGGVARARTLVANVSLPNQRGETW